MLSVGDYIFDLEDNIHRTITSIMTVDGEVSFTAEEIIGGVNSRWVQYFQLKDKNKTWEQNPKKIQDARVKYILARNQVYYLTEEALPHGIDYKVYLNENDKGIYSSQSEYAALEVFNQI